MGFTVNRSMMLAGGIPAMLQFVSMLLLRNLRDRLANVTIDSLSLSRSRSCSRSRKSRSRAPVVSLASLPLNPWCPVSCDPCTLGANDVSAVETTYDELSLCGSPLNIDSGLVVELCDTISFSGTVLTLSECSDPCDSSSLAKSTLFKDFPALLADALSCFM